MMTELQVTTALDIAYRFAVVAERIAASLEKVVALIEEEQKR